MNCEELTLVKKKRVTLRKAINSNKIYINTLVPYFEFKNKFGKIIKPENCCIIL